MKKFVIGIVGALIVLAIVGGSGLGVGYFSAHSNVSWLKWLRADPPSSRSLGPTVAELEDMGELVVTRVQVSDVLEAEGLGHRGLWLVRGDALIAVNMADVELVSNDADNRTVVLRLPAPTVVSARVDHEKTKTFDFESTTWLPWRKGDQGTLRDNAMLHAQRLVQHSAQQNAGLEHNKQTCELILQSLYRQVSWDVQVEWEHESTIEDLDAMTDGVVSTDS